jgi:hypothetical protein
LIAALEAGAVAQGYMPKPGHAQFDARSGRETAVQFESEE